MSKVVTSGWVTPTLLLTPSGHNEHHREFIHGLIAGVSGAAVHVDNDDAALVIRGRAIPLATGHRWARLARMQQRAVLIVCPHFRAADVDAHSFIRRWGTSATTAIVPVVPAVNSAHRCEGTYIHKYSLERCRCGRTDTQDYGGRRFCDEHQPTSH